MCHSILYRTIVLHTCINIIITFSYPFTGVIFGICLAVCQVEVVVVAIATGLIVHFVTKGCIKQNLTLSQDRSENTVELTKQLHVTKIKTHRPFKTAQIVQPYTPLHLVQTNLTQVTINHVYRHTTRKPTHSRASNKLHRTATATTQERRRKPSPPLTLLTYLLVFRHKEDNFPRTLTHNYVNVNYEGKCYRKGGAISRS